jgi:hypothetical protein
MCRFEDRSFGPEFSGTVIRDGIERMEGNAE